MYRSKLRLPLIILLLAGLTGTWAHAQTNAPVAPPQDPVQVDLRALYDKAATKVRAGQKTAADLAPELAEYDALLAKYRGQPEAESMIAFDKAMFSYRVLKDEASCRLQLEAIQKNYPGSKVAEGAVTILRAISPEGKAEAQAKAAAEKAKLDALTGAAAPELDITWASRAGLTKLADLRGRVVVLDFWATWCGPCIKSFPKVRAEVEHFRASPVTFLGVTSLQGKVHGLESKPIDVKDDPAREYALTAEFMKKHDMTWDVVFSKAAVFNPDYAVKSIPNIVIIAPDGKVRHAGLSPNNPDVDIAGKITALLQEFGLPVPN